MSSRKKQLAHLFDATQCIHCGACSAACAATNYPELINEFNAGWNTIYCNIRQVKSEKNRPVQLLVQCQQCADAPCVTTCPLGANYYDENLETIFHDALDARFEQYLEDGRQEYGVTITADYKKLDLLDLQQYVH